MRGIMPKTSKQSGFTIIELMIATSVLSVILLIVTTIMISIGSLYYKGVSQVRVQDDVRSISDELSRQLKLSNLALSPLAGPTPIGGYPSDAYAYCIGNTRYSFVLGVQLGRGRDTDGSLQIPHVLWRDTNTSGACSPLNLTQANPTASAGPGNSLPGSGAELGVPNSRLTSFSIAGASSPYTISLEIASGSIDLLSGATGAVHCLGTVGDQFCATANLTTTVVSRL
jgi:prepilin-type N-terminal cleavage/methylation domain-containing protein